MKLIFNVVCFEVNTPLAGYVDFFESIFRLIKMT